MTEFQKKVAEILLEAPVCTTCSDCAEYTFSAIADGLIQLFKAEDATFKTEEFELIYQKDEQGED